MKFCPTCGAQVSETQTFCGSCGTALTPVSSVNEEPVRQQPDYQQQNYQQGYQQPYYQQQSYQQAYQQTGYQQPAGGFRQAGGYQSPIQKRNIGTCIILTIVTCGIYGLYWYFCIINDLNTASQHPDDKSAGTVLLLSIVTCGIYSWIWLYKAGEKVDAIKQFNGEAPSNSSLLYILLAIFGLGFIDYCLIQTELNKVAAYAE